MKKDNKIPLRGGYLTFLKDRMEISDNSRLEKILILVVFFSTSLYGLYNMLTYSSMEGPMMYYSGMIILITWALATPFLIRRTYKHVLFYNEIGEVDMMEHVGGAFQVKLQLKKGKIRMIHLGRNRKNVNLFIKQINTHHLGKDYQTMTA